MELVYICSPYADKTKKGIKNNIELAKKYARKAYQMGYNVICPHINFSFLDETHREGILEMCKELVKICDEIWIIKKNNKISAGQEIEIYVAMTYNLNFRIFEVKQK